LSADAGEAVTDFAVRVNDEHRIEFVSASRGRLASFPAWEHADRDLRHFVAADVPLGTFDAPYEDADEGWRIAIYEHAGWVYVDENGVSFRVPRERYLRAWAAVIDQFNPITPLDDGDSGDPA